MRKEVILAITIGFGLGLIITYGIWLANKSLKSLPQTSMQTEPTASPSIIPVSVTTSPQTPVATTVPTQNQSGSSNIKFTSPEDEIIADKDTVTVSGETTPNSIVALTYEGAEQIVTSDSSGKFTADIPLDGGYNLISATAFDKSGNSSSANLTITFTTSKI